MAGPRGLVAVMGLAVLTACVTGPKLLLSEPGQRCDLSWFAGHWLAFDWTLRDTLAGTLWFETSGDSIVAGEGRLAVPLGEDEWWILGRRGEPPWLLRGSWTIRNDGWVRFDWAPPAQGALLLDGGYPWRTDGVRLWLDYPDQPGDSLTLELWCRGAAA